MKGLRKVLQAGAAGICCFLLLGYQAKESHPKTAKPSEQTSLMKTENVDFRLNFNKIKVSEDRTAFTGGTNLEELKKLLGEPVKHEKKPAGEVTLDSYTWERDGAAIVVHLYQNSTVARSITNFSFKRKAKISQSDFQKLQTRTSYKQVIEQLGEPDVLSQSVSSDKSEIQAVWTSDLQTESESADITLYFENDLLKNKFQNGLK